MRLVGLHLVRPLLVLLILSLNIYAQAPPQISLSEFDDLATTLVTLKTQEEREQLLAKNRALMTPDLRKALIKHGNSQLLAGRYSTAFDIYGVAQNVAEQIGDKEGVATAWLDIGTVYYFQANYPAAFEHYKKARDLFTEVTNHYEAAKALSGLALIYKEQRRETEALAALQQVLQEFTSLGDMEETANTLNMIGTIYYGQGNYSAAADAFRKSGEANRNVDSVVRLADVLYMQGDYGQALAFYKESLERVSRTEIGATIAALNGAANSAYYSGNYDEALEYFQRSVNVQKTQPDRLGLATALRGIGNVHRTRGDYGAALESYFNSLSIFEEIKAPLGTTLGSIGLVRAFQGDYARALEYYRKALEEFKTHSNQVEMARVLTLIGNVYYAQGLYDAALGSYRQALVLREAMDDKAGQGDIVAGIGSTLLRQKNYSEALDSFEKALGLFKSVNNQEKMADVLTRISDAFLLQNDYAKALSAAESAATIAIQLGNSELQWYARMLSGKAHVKLEQGSQAYNSFTGAISIVESLREDASGAGDHSRSLPYLSAIDLLMTQRRPSEAFHDAERAKIQFLIDLLKNNNATPQKGLSVDQRREEQRLAGEVASLEIQLDREREQRSSSEARRVDLQDRLRKARAAYAGFRQQVFSAIPGLKTSRGELAPLKLDDIPSLITDTSTALLEYTITENNTYLFVLTADKTAAKTKRRTEINLKVYPLEIKHGELAPKVRNFQQQLSSRADNFHELARELYDLLVKPAEDQIGLKTKLVIVPDGLLWHLPFEALQPAEDHYVVDHAQVSYASSLSALREMRKQRLPAGRLNSLLVAYGSPELSKSFMSRFELAYAGIKLESTPEQEEEIRRIATTYGATTSRLYAGPQASEERVKSDTSRARILHFSGPAVLDDTSPMSSFIGLSSTAGRQDGFLQIRETMDLQSTAELVVASTAQQSAGLNGNAAVGFAWAWFVAGTPATLVSRWNVEPSTFLAGFYSSIKPANRARVSKARALHQSLLAVRRSADHQHPYYWASFAMIGDAR
ncbi:MAG TPA: tetratricopeptide repeat protein [Pyrinomonadaceae bacterium]